ncbi:hypothetical protein Q7P35_005565 [Cladosporium inversicolor]
MLNRQPTKVYLPDLAAEMYVLYPTSSLSTSWLLATSLVSGHMFISSPSPIGETAVKEPLSPNGDNFPCHGVSLPTAGGMRMHAGSKQSLEFDTGDGANTAVHGGGSCQISITYESDPVLLKDPQNWRVLYSIQGGCPSNTHLNLDGVFTSPAGPYQGSWPCTNESTNGIDCTNSFDFELPEGLKNGHAIMAWTWFNTVGNRHMFMNCINVDIEGGDASEMDSLPSMFVANIGNGCETPENHDLAFPSPGRYLTTKLPSAGASRTAASYPTTTPKESPCVGSASKASEQQDQTEDQSDPQQSGQPNMAESDPPETRTSCSLKAK